MRKAMFYLLVVVVGSWTNSFGRAREEAPYARILARVAKYNQTAPIPPTKIYTPKDWSLCRVSAFGIVTAPGGSGRWAPTIQWTDAAGQKQVILFYLDSNQKWEEQSPLPFLIRVKPGVPLEYFVDANGDVNGSKYNLLIVIERLM